MKKLLLLMILSPLYSMHKPEQDNPEEIYPIPLVHTQVMREINNKQEIIHLINKCPGLTPEKKKELISQEIEKIMKIIDNLTLTTNDHEDI